MVIPLVNSVLPVRHDPGLILATLRTRAVHWEQQRSAPSRFPIVAASTKRETPAQVIERLRHREGWTMEALAEKANLDIKQVYHVKRGNGVHSTTIGKLAHALGCPVVPLPQSARRNSHSRRVPTPKCQE